MSRKDFPLCRTAQLTVFNNPKGGIEYREYVLARDVEGLLANAILVVGNNVGSANCKWETAVEGTHTARLLMIELIVKEQGLALTKWAIDMKPKGVHPADWMEFVMELDERAKRLLDKEKK